jgi:hypothetical protein
MTEPRNNPPVEQPSHGPGDPQSTGAGPRTMRRPPGHNNSWAVRMQVEENVNRWAAWRDIVPADWTLDHSEGEAEYWRRPGKASGHSAITGKYQAPYRGSLLFVCSKHVPPFEYRASYTKFEAYCLLNHGGKVGQAVAHLQRLGYDKFIPKTATGPTGLLPLRPSPDQGS